MAPRGPTEARGESGGGGQTIRAPWIWVGLRPGRGWGVSRAEMGGSRRAGPLCGTLEEKAQWPAVWLSPGPRAQLGGSSEGAEGGADAHREGAGPCVPCSGPPSLVPLVF